jgi:TPR repeat protein
MKQAAGLYSMGAQPNYPDSMADLRRLADAGCAAAEMHMGMLLYHGLTSDAKEQKENRQAVMWFKKAAEQGESHAQFLLGRCFFQAIGVEEDPSEAARWVTAAAEQQHLDAIRLLGHFYAYGDCVRKNSGKADALYRRAFEISLERAGRQDQAALYLVGQSYWLGQGVKKDYKLAAEWFLKAAECGNAAAMCLLGEASERGQGIERDYAQAAEWYRRAANHGSLQGLEHLARCYEQGIGVAKNPEKAYEFYTMAFNNGSSQAGMVLERRYGHMLPPDDEDPEADSGFPLGDDYRDISRQLEDYNWDEGLTFPQRLLDTRGCDLALALKIFYLADGYRYLLRFTGEEPEGLADWREFIEQLYAGITENRFPDMDHAYQVPLTKVQKFRLKKAGVPEIFLENV